VPTSIRIEIGPGELLDRITIARIRLQHLADDQREDAAARLATLQAVWNELPAIEALAGLEAELAEVNSRLWLLEDALRACEARGDFGADFIRHARAVCRSNDRRAAIKAAIDSVLGCAARDGKVYSAR